MADLVKMPKAYKVLVRDGQTKDGKKKFKSFKIVDEERQGKLVDCVMCKSIDDEKMSRLSKTHKAYITGDINISYNYEYPKAFVRQIDDIKEI